MMINKDTWIISDTHFGHQNIIRYCNRPYNNWDLILENWRGKVGHEDTVLHLGDVLFKNKDEWFDEIKRLPGKVYFIKGNHDHSNTVKRLRNIGWTPVEPFTYEVGERIILFSHYPNTDRGLWELNIHGHIHNNDYSTEFYLSATPENEYFNASIEMMDYSPVKLGYILERLRNMS